MEIKANRVDEANIEAQATVSKETLEKKRDQIAKKMAKNIKLDGFRKGKVPAAVVKARFKDQITNDVHSEIIKESIDKALEECGVEFNYTIGQPLIPKFDIEDEKIEIEIKLSLKPNINVEGYKDLVPAYDEPEIGDEEIDGRLKEMLNQIAKFKEVEDKDKALDDGDYAVIDFEGFVDGEPFEGGKATEYKLKIGSGQFIEGFEDSIKGMKIGEHREISVKFPEDYNSKELAGKDATFKVTLHRIEELETPELDEDALKKLMPGEKEPTEEKLRERIKEQIKAEKLSKLFSDELKPKFTEALVKNINFALPANIVEKELDILAEQKLKTLTQDELKEYQEDNKKYEALRDGLRSDAEDSVKLTFIIDELAKLENITVDDQEVIQAIYLEAYRSGQDPKQYFEFYEKQGILPAIKMSMIEDKLFAHLFTNKPDEESESK